MMRAGKFAGALYCALATVLFYLTARRLFPRWRRSGTVLFGLGTMVWSTASQALWGHAPAVFCVTLGLHLLLRDDELPAGRAALAGLAFGLGVLCRPTVLLFPAVIGGWLFLRGDRRAGFALGLAALPGLAALAAYNCAYTGTLFEGGYALTEDPWRTPIWFGLLGLTVSPSRGLLFYVPAVVVSLLGAVRLVAGRAGPRGSRQRVLAGAAAAGAATLLVYSRWYGWHGGWAYGPRYLTELMPVVGLLFCAGASGLTTRRARRVAVGLVAASVVVHFLGVFGHDDDWHARQEKGRFGAAMFDLRDPQTLAAVRALLSEVLPEPDEPKGEKAKPPKARPPEAAPPSPGPPKWSCRTGRTSLRRRWRLAPARACRRRSRCRSTALRRSGSSTSRRARSGWARPGANRSATTRRSSTRSASSQASTWASPRSRRPSGRPSWARIRRTSAAANCRWTA